MVGWTGQCDAMQEGAEEQRGGRIGFAGWVRGLAASLVSESSASEWAGLHKQGEVEVGARDWTHTGALAQLQTCEHSASDPLASRVRVRFRSIDRLPPLDSTRLLASNKPRRSEQVEEGEREGETEDGQAVGAGATALA